MANNKAYEIGYKLAVACTVPAVPTAGQPVLYGIATGVAETTEDAAGITSVDFGPGVWRIPVTDTLGAVAVGAAVFLDAAGVGLSNTPAGFFFGYALEPVLVGATTTIMVMHIPSPGAATLGAGTIATANLAAGIISTNAPGRALMANGVFDVATVLAKFAAGSFTTANLTALIPDDAVTNAILLDIVLNGAFQADAPTRALFANDIWDEAHILDGTLTANVVSETADDNLTGGIPVVHRFSIADQATGDVDYVLVHALRIMNVTVIKRAAAGAGANTIQIQTGAGAAITDAMVINIADNAVVGAATIDDATHEIADGGVLRVHVVRAAGTSGCDVYVSGLRVA